MLQAELGFAVAREGIAIGDGAEEIDGRGAELDLAHLFLGERLRQSRLDGEAVASWIDNALTALRRAPVEAVGHRIEHFAVCPVAHAVRRRLPEIADGAFDHGLLSGGDAGDEGFARAEIGAELHLGEVMRAGYEIARGEPQEDGGKQKNEGKGGDDVVAVLGVEARKALPRAPRHEDIGTVGLRCSRGRCGLRRSLFEAGLERGRHADEQDADQEQDTEKDPGAQSEHPRRSEKLEALPKLTGTALPRKALTAEVRNRLRGRTLRICNPSPPNRGLMGALGPLKSSHTPAWNMLCWVLVIVPCDHPFGTEAPVDPPWPGLLATHDKLSRLRGAV